MECQRSFPVISAIYIHESGSKYQEIFTALRTASTDFSLFAAPVLPEQVALCSKVPYIY